MQYYCYDTPGSINVPLQKWLGSEYDLFQWQINLLYSAYSLPNIFLPLVGGLFVDFLGPSRMLMVFSVLVCTGQALFAAGLAMKNFWLMVFGRLVFGLGGESLEVAQARIVTDWFKGRGLAFALGLNLSFARIATALNDNISPWIVGQSDPPTAGWPDSRRLAGVPLSKQQVANEKKAQSRSEEEQRPFILGPSPITGEDGEGLESVGSATVIDGYESEEFDEEDDETLYCSQVTGLTTSFWTLCISTVLLYAVFPLLVAHIRNFSPPTDFTTSLLFFIGLGALAFVVTITLNVLDRVYGGSVLNLKGDMVAAPKVAFKSEDDEEPDLVVDEDDTGAARVVGTGGVVKQLNYCADAWCPFGSTTILPQLKILQVSASIIPAASAIGRPIPATMLAPSGSGYQAPQLQQTSDNFPSVQQSGGSRRISYSTAAGPYAEFQTPSSPAANLLGGTPYSPATATASTANGQLLSSGAAQAQMTLDMAMRDTPAFRASLTVFQAELEGIQKWLDGVVKGGKLYADELARNNEVVLETINMEMINGASKFLRDDMKDMKDFDKIHSKITERYDNALAKYASLPKTKEPSALREDAFVLYEARKAYIRSSIEYAYKILQFKNKIEMLVVDTLINMMGAHGAFFETSSDVFKGIKPSMNALKIRLEDARRTLPTVSEIEERKKSLEDEAIARANPTPIPSRDTSIQDLTSISGAPNSDSTNIRQMVPALAAAAAAAAAANANAHGSSLDVCPKEMEGHLFRRSGNGPKGWTRCYVILQQGQLWIQYLKQNGPGTSVDGMDVAIDSVAGGGAVNGPGNKKGGRVVTLGPVNIVLCGTRIERNSDRRFCFEIYTPMKSFMMQAETEKEMYEWIATIEESKNSLRSFVEQRPSMSYQAPGIPSRNPYNGGETDAENDIATDRRHFTPVYPAPVVSSPAYRERLARVFLPSPTSSSPPPAPGGGEQEDDYEENEDAVLEVAMEEDGARLGGVRDFFYEDKVMGEIRYPDAVWEKRDRELHNLLKSVPQSDHVIDVFTVALQKELALQGKIYITQNRICFHSNILGFVNVLVIHLTSIKSIVKVKGGPFHSSINVETLDGMYNFKTFLKDDTKIYGALRTCWQNSIRSEKDGRMNTQDLFDHIFHTYHKLDEKEKPSRGGKWIPGTDNKDESSAQLEDGTGDAGAVDGGEAAKKDGVEGSSGADDEYALPPSIPPPAGEVHCSCGDAGHLEKQECNLVFPVSAKRFYELMFGVNPDNASLYEKYHTPRGEAKRQVGPWVEPPKPEWLIGGEPQGAIAAREAHWVMPFNNPVGESYRFDDKPLNFLLVRAKEVRVDEFSFMMERKEYLCYVVECRSQTPEVPYGDAFSPITRWCITWINKDTCRVKAHSTIRWYKNPLIKSLIKSEGGKGISKGVQDITTAIKNEIDIIHSRSGKSPAPSVGTAQAETPGGKDGAQTPSGGTPQGGGGLGTEGIVARAKEPEPVLPLGLSSFWGQWGILALLVLSLLTNAVWLISGLRRPAHPVVQSTSLPGPGFGWVPDGAGSGSGVMWEKELGGQLRGDLHEKAMLAFITSHFQGPHPHTLQNTTTPSGWSPTRDRTDVDVPSKSYFYHLLAPPPTSPQPIPDSSDASLPTPPAASVPPPRVHLLHHARLAELQASLRAAREESRRMMGYLDEVEKGLVWARFWNWVADGAGAGAWERGGGVLGCRVGVGEAVGGCEGILALMRGAETV
ncbi:hypothetical protein HDU96_009345 [Phlyctochytrium bullatum]|nr:hypothetical protein HDU96_009345 [Phlyctochytrium bullatum]